MKIFIQLTFALLFVLFNHSLSAQMIPTPASTSHNPVYCTSWDCIEKNANRSGKIEGVFQKYTPAKSGKGAGHMFWQWEIVLSDSTAIPVSDQNKKIQYASFTGRKVVIEGTIFYGIIIGSSNPNEQSATGYRIDPEEITIKK